MIQNEPRSPLAVSRMSEVQDRDETRTANVIEEKKKLEAGKNRSVLLFPWPESEREVISVTASLDPGIVKAVPERSGGVFAATPSDSERTKWSETMTGERVDLPGSDSFIGSQMPESSVVPKQVHAENAALEPEWGDRSSSYYLSNHYLQSPSYGILHRATFSTPPEFSRIPDVDDGGHFSGPRETLSRENRKIPSRESETAAESHQLSPGGAIENSEMENLAGSVFPGEDEAAISGEVEDVQLDKVLEQARIRKGRELTSGEARQIQRLAALQWEEVSDRTGLHQERDESRFFRQDDVIGGSGFAGNSEPLDADRYNREIASYVKKQSEQLTRIVDLLDLLRE